MSGGVEWIRIAIGAAGWGIGALACIDMFRASARDVGADYRFYFLRALKRAAIGGVLLLIGSGSILS